MFCLWSGIWRPGVIRLRRQDGEGRKKWLERRWRGPRPPKAAPSQGGSAMAAP